MTDFKQWLLERPGYRQPVEQAHSIKPANRDAALAMLSPLNHIEAFRGIPVFLLHGDRDTTVLPHHSRDFAAALKKQGCAVTYREAKGETHRDQIAQPYQQELADFLTQTKR